MAFERERKLMVDGQIAGKVHDERVLEVMRRLPRHKFVPRQDRSGSDGDVFFGSVPLDQFDFAT